MPAPDKTKEGKIYIKLMHIFFTLFEFQHLANRTVDLLQSNLMNSDVFLYSKYVTLHTETQKMIIY